jgi:hypothetical protein
VNEQRTPELEAENEMSMLLKYYIQKIFSKIKTPKKVKEKTAPTRKMRRNGQDVRKIA